MTDRTALTIAALSTPPGRGGVALLRLSGKDALSIAEKVFTPVGTLPLSETPGNRVRYGSFTREGKLLDRGLVTVFRAPHSYTGEDTVELCCHGGVLLCTRLLEGLFEAGAVPAEPGEFTKRAFVAGKLGLSEAEAVMDAIDAESDAALEIAAANLNGALGKAIKVLSDRLTALLAAAYVCGDYPDEDLADLTPAEMKTELQGCIENAAALRDTYRHGHALTEGIACAIVGRPNVGKSALLNALLGRDRAIVSNEAGTTRDTVEETVYFGNVKLRLIDTAGIREGTGEVERQGVRRSFAAAEKAELLLAVYDGSAPATEEDAALLAHWQNSGKPMLSLLNKSDLPRKFSLPLPEALPVSTVTGEGLDALKKKIKGLYENEALRDPSVTPVLASARQYAAVGKAIEAMQNAIRALEVGYTPDTAGLDMEAALSALLEIDGRAALDNVVDNIFHRFCVGK